MDPALEECLKRAKEMTDSTFADKFFYKPLIYAGVLVGSYVLTDITSRIAYHKSLWDVLFS